MTRNVVRSKRTTSVAPHASARVVRCFERTEAFGIRVWTIRDHAYPDHNNIRRVAGMSKVERLTLYNVSS